MLIHRRRTTLQQVSSVWSCEWITALCVCLPLFSHRTPGYHRWTSSETPGSVVCGLSTKRRTCRCQNLRYPLWLEDRCHTFPCGYGVLSKVADTPPSHSSPGCEVKMCLSVTKIIRSALMHVCFYGLDRVHQRDL